MQLIIKYLIIVKLIQFLNHCLYILIHLTTLLTQFDHHVMITIYLLLIQLILIHLNFLLIISAPIKTEITAAVNINEPIIVDSCTITTDITFNNVNDAVNVDAGPININNVAVAAEFESSDNIDINMIDHASNDNDDDLNMDMHDMDMHMLILNTSKVANSRAHAQKKEVK